MIRIIDVMTIGETTPAKQRTNEERRLFHIAASVIIVPTVTPLVPVSVVVVQVGPRLGGGGGGGGRRRRDRGCGVSPGPSASAGGQLRVAALSFGGELSAVVQQEAARDEKDGTREGERHGQSGGRWCIVGRRNQWASSPSSSYAATSTTTLGLGQA